jgi:uncharacterized protein YcbK (DUF882 family)
MDRRHFLLGMTGAAFGSTMASRAARAMSLDMSWRDVDPVLDLHGANTGDVLKVRFHRPEGYDLDAVALLNWVMRDWREDTMRPVDVKLLWGLAALRARFMRDGHEGTIRLLSGFRTRRTNDLLRRQGRGAAIGSLHLQARAVDFTFAGVETGEVAREAAGLEIGGVGNYPKNGFVHMDTGAVRYWSS